MLSLVENDEALLVVCEWIGAGVAKLPGSVGTTFGYVLVRRL